MIFDHGPQDRNQRFVLLCLGERADSSGYCFPLIEDIAKRTLFAEKYVVTTIAELTKNGWVDKVKHPTNYKRHAYRVNLTKLLSGEQSSGQDSSGQQSSGSNEGQSQVNFEDVSGSNGGDPPHPLLGVTVINRQLTVIAEGFTRHMIAKKIMAESRMSSEVVFSAVAAQVQLEIGNGDTDEETANEISSRMVHAWASYRGFISAGKMEFQWAAQKFFGEGYWRDQAGWPWKKEPGQFLSAKEAKRKAFLESED